jgi:hypothetical protein
MEVNFYNTKISNTPSFGEKYPLRDVLSIMSSSEIVGRKSDTFEKTISGILNKKAGLDPEEKMRDYFHARDYLNEKYPQLYEMADSFRKMIDSVNRNHFAITDAQAKTVFANAESQSGKSFIEIV